MAFTSSGSSSSSDSEVDSCSKTCLESVEARLAHYKKNEVVFEESINVLKLEVRLRDNALNEYKMNLEKAEKERDQLKQTLEKFQNSSKSLNNILESQVIDKFKTGLGYDAATAASPAVESFVNLTDKSGSDKGYHSVPPPLTGNFIPRKPDLTFMDEIVESENLDVTTVVTPSNDKTVENKGVSNTVESNAVRMNNTSAPIIEDWNSDDESEIDYTVRPSTEKIKSVKTVRETDAPKQNKHHPRGNQRNWNNLMSQRLGSDFKMTNKACYVCGSFEHLHYVCDKKIVRPVWNNSRRVNHKNFTNKMTHPHPKRSFVTQAVLTRSGKLSTAGVAVNTVRPVNTANTKTVNTVRSVNIAASKLIVNHPRTKTNAFKRGYSQSSRPSNRHFANKNSIINTNVNTARVKHTIARDRAVGIGSGSGPRCQDPILGDVDAQTRFETTSKQFNDPPLSKFNTFRSGEDTNPIIYTSCIQQFWATTNVNMVNGVRQLQALIDKKKMIIKESSIRSDLHFEDAEGIDCLPTTTIFEELAKMGLSAKSTAWNEFSSTMASLIICLATNQKFNLSKYIIDVMLGDMSHHKEIYVNPSYTKKLFANMKRAGNDFSGRITPLFDTMMVQASEEVGEDSDHPTDSNQIPIVDQPSTSSQPKHKQKSKRKQRKEAEVAHDEIKHEESVPTPSNDPLPSGEDSMQLNDLMVLCTKLKKQVLDLEKAKSDQAIKIASLKKRVDKLEKRRKFRTIGLKRLKKDGAARRIESSIDINETQERQDEDLMFDDGVLDGDEMFVDATTDSAAPTIPTTVEETLAQTLMEIKAAKSKAKGIVFHDLKKQVSKPTVSVRQPSIKDKGKGIMQEPERPLIKKDQVALDEDLARNIQA
ncbi:hypothetical protein Tco_0576119 [Tanacetum coccineum]